MTTAVEALITDRVRLRPGTTPPIAGSLTAARSTGRARRPPVCSRPNPARPPMRLIDLHVDWLLQYARETTVFDPALYPGVEARSGRPRAILQSTRRGLLSCYRTPTTGPPRPIPGRPSGKLIARIEAEFPGRLLIGPDDFDRWQDDPNGLAWGMIGVEGFDSLIRSDDDLERLPSLSSEASGSSSRSTPARASSGGSSSPGDDRGLTDLGRRFLETPRGLAPEGPGPGRSSTSPT